MPATMRCWAPVAWCATPTWTRALRPAAPAPPVSRLRLRRWATTATCFHRPPYCRAHRGSLAGQASPDHLALRGNRGHQDQLGLLVTEGIREGLGFWVWGEMELSAQPPTARCLGWPSTRGLRTPMKAMRSSSLTTWSPTWATILMGFRASSSAAYRALTSSSTMCWWEEAMAPACGQTSARTARLVLSKFPLSSVNMSNPDAQCPRPRPLLLCPKHP